MENRKGLFRKTKRCGLYDDMREEMKKLPNWIGDNDWSNNKRLQWLNILMAHDSRDWSVYPYAEQGAPDWKQWSIWCLVTSDTKTKAIEAWEGFCEQYKMFN